MNNNSAIFAYSRTKYQESKLIGAERLNRMLSAKNCEEALKVLHETTYSENASVTDCSKFTLLTVAEKDRLIDFFKEVCPDENVKACFLKQYDYHNAKAFVKEKFSRTDGYADIIYNYGLIEPKSLKDAVKNENYTNLPLEMTQALNNIDLNYVSYGINPRLWELELDRALNADIASYANKTKFSAVKDYFILKTDIENLLSMLKCKLLGLKTSYLNEQFLSGGSVELNLYSASLGANVENAAESFKNTRIYTLAQNGYKNFEKTGITYFEREASIVLSGYFNGMRGESETVYPLLDFYLKKYAEIKNIDLIFSAMLGGAEIEEIKNRIVLL
jgi:vacuolar-type H+-ATPase subunit C/Vma6